MTVMQAIVQASGPESSGARCAACMVSAEIQGLVICSMVHYFYFYCSN